MTFALPTHKSIITNCTQIQQTTTNIICITRLSPIVHLHILVVRLYRIYQPHRYDRIGHKRLALTERITNTNIRSYIYMIIFKYENCSCKRSTGDYQFENMSWAFRAHWLVSEHENTHTHEKTCICVYWLDWPIRNRTLITSIASQRIASHLCVRCIRSTECARWTHVFGFVGATVQPQHNYVGFWRAGLPACYRILSIAFHGIGITNGLFFGWTLIFVW